MLERKQDGSLLGQKLDANATAWNECLGGKGARFQEPSAGADRIVLSVSVRDPERQLAEGQFVEITEAGGVRLRPWSIRYATPDELDRMAISAGCHLEHRWATFDRTPFDDDANRHVTVYRLT